MTLGSKKDYKASSITTFFLAWLEQPPKVMTRGEACLAFLFMLKLAVGAPSYCFIYGNEMASLSRLMVATQQVWENNYMGA
jgi:hypothetical protein